MGQAPNPASGLSPDDIDDPEPDLASWPTLIGDGSSPRLPTPPQPDPDEPVALRE